MYAEADLVPLSALQHFVVCPRQCALIHLEQTWVESGRTAEGRVRHQRIDRGGHAARPGIRQAFALPLRSLVLGVAGRADVVEFRDGAPPFPVEHKHGRPKRGDEDRVQLCAQALCLEEMLGVEVAAGALFYGETRRRHDVRFDAGLRRRTADVAAAVHAMLESQVTPAAPADAPCRRCSLEAVCSPKLTGRGSVQDWLARRLAAEDGEGEP